MKKKFISIALCLTLIAGALALSSCTANTAGNADGNGTTSTDSANKDTEAATKEKETQSSVIGEAESMVGEAKDRIMNGMGDPRFSDYPHRGITPGGK